MTETIAPVVPAGWYDDPADPAAVRWWSGEAWTPYTNPKQPAPYTLARVAPGSAQTPGVWLLAFLPLMTLVMIGIIIAIFLASGQLIPTPSAYLVVVGLSWWFGWLDVRELRRRGFSPPSLLWMLLLPPLGYLIARGRVLRKQGGRVWPPEVVFVGILALGMVVGGVIAAIAVASSPFAHAQASLAGQSYYAGTFGETGTPNQDDVEAMLATTLAPDGSFPVDCTGALVARGMNFICFADDTLSTARLQLDVKVCDCGDVFFTFQTVSPSGGEAEAPGALHGTGNGIVVAQASSAGSIPDETLPWQVQIEDSLSQWGGYSFVDCSVSADVIDKVSTFDCFGADGDTPYNLSVTITDLGNIEYTATPLDENGVPVGSQSV